ASTTYASWASPKMSPSAVAGSSSSILRETPGKSSGRRTPPSTIAAVSSFPKSSGGPKKWGWRLLHFEREHPERRPEPSGGSRLATPASQVEACLGGRNGDRRRRSGRRAVDVHHAHARRRRHDPPDRAPPGGRLRA